MTNIYSIAHLPHVESLSYLEQQAADASAHMQSTLKDIGLDPMKWAAMSQEDRDAVLAHCKCEARKAGHNV